MTAHQTANDEIRQLASLFAAAALPPDEEAEFQERVKSSGVCAEEARAFREAAGWLLSASDGVAARPNLREKPLARIQQLEPPLGMQIVRADEGAWRTLGPNASLPARREPGAKHPPHSQAGVEDLVLRPGTHRSSHTAIGCTVSIGASHQNAMLPWTR